ncbi:MAG: TIGR04255 family protein [Candidatus Hydrogenedentes bacterium]|nr:TIGR04255 family protein [Candidatus Hydrogenedentota bacterium]
MPSEILKNKPLVEAICQVKWKLESEPGQGLPVDTHYRLLLGRFSERIQEKYPFHEALPTAQIPDELVSHRPQHRFRNAPADWPLIQLGPGIMTINETDRYVWESFFKNCEDAVKSLYDSHPTPRDFAIQSLSLRYIDAVEVDFQEESVFAFLKSKFKTEIALPGSLFDNPDVQKEPVDFSWQASFPLGSSGDIITLRFAKGEVKGKSALIWETLVQTNDDTIELTPEVFPDWLTKAHELTHDWFFKLIAGELEGRFSK